MTDWRVIHSDCVEAMREMPGESVDAVVTDPPAGIAFMNRSWDGNRGGRDLWIEWLTGVMAECLRLLKPGGHVLVWALPRTSHWTGMALEDAGFEIRDVVTHHFGSGFPKSLDVSKAIDRQRNDRPDILRVTLFLADAAEKAGITRAQVDKHMATADMGAWWLSRLPHRCACPTWEQWLRLKLLVRCSDEMDAEVWRLNGRKGTPGEAWEQREVLGRRLGAQAESTGRFGGWGNDSGDGRSEFADTAPATPEAQCWSGWGTALKPSTEFWFLARRPFAGSVAQNVLEHGVGALNIDAARVGGGGHLKWAEPRDMGYHGGTNSCAEATEATAGRWPPNLALVHSAGCLRVGTRRVKGITGGFTPGSTGAFGKHGCYGEAAGQDARAGYASPDGTEEVEAWKCQLGCPVAEMDAQSGELSGPGSSGGSGMGYRGGDAPRGVPSRGDSGGASRFFPQFSWEHERAEAGFLYQAKASRAEREAGLDALPQRPAGVGMRSTDSGQYIDFIHPVPAAIGAWLRDKRLAAGLSAKDLCERIGAHGAVNHGGAVANWEAGYNRPTPEQWRRLRDVLGFDDRYDEAMTATRFVDRQVFDDRPRAVARNRHPTVKPIALMRWLVRLVTPPTTPDGMPGLVLDPFAGSGTTGCAAVLESRRFIGIEQSNTPDEPYVDIARARIAYWADPEAHAARLAEARRLAVVEEDAESVEVQLGLFGGAA